MDWPASPQVLHRTPLAHRPSGPAHILSTPGAFGWKPLRAFHTTLCSDFEDQQQNWCMSKKKRTPKDLDFSSVDQERLAAWRPAFDWIRHERWKPAGTVEQLEANLAFILDDLPLYSPFTIENAVPARGLLSPKPVNPPEKIYKPDFVNWCIDVAKIYLAALEFSEKSPSLEDSIREIAAIKELAEKLYIGLTRTNQLTKYYMHNVSGMNRTAQDSYLRAAGESLPRCHSESDLQKMDWYRRLSGLIDFCKELEIEFKLFTNPTKGPLFNKEFGTPEFILVWNCHILLLLLGEQTTGYRGCNTAKLAKVIRKFATAVELTTEWPDEHLRSILEWYKARNRNREHIKATETILEQQDLSEADRKTFETRLDGLGEQEAWLFENAGRVSEEYRTGRGNLTLFRDPMFPLEME